MLDLTGNNNEAWYDAYDDTAVVEEHSYATSAAIPAAVGQKRPAEAQRHPQKQQHSRQRLTAATPAASGDGPQEAELGMVWYSAGSTEAERLWSAGMSSGGAAMSTWGSQAGEPASVAKC